MKSSIKFIKLFLVLIILTSCKTTIKKEIPIKNSEDQNIENAKTTKNKIEIKISCGESDVSEYLNNGWIILEEASQEKICSWKSFPATKDCDMEKDKGCKITKPDEIGEEKIYILEKP